MAAELKGEWSLTEVTKSGVTSKTASYKINGKEVIKLTNLSPDLTVDETNKTINGLTVDEDNKTVTLSGSALNKQTVAFTSSTYKLELDNVPAVEFTVGAPVVSGGKATFNGDLSEGYTLSANGKTLTYSDEKENQLLATVSGLATTATENDVVYDDGVITLSPDALKAAKVSLTLKNGAAFTLAIDDDVQKIETSGTWTVTNGTATLKGTVTQDGYALAPDGKSVNYLKANANTATLATVKGLNTTYTDDMDVATTVDENGNYIITLPQAALNAKDVTVSGTGYALALEDGSVPTSETVEKTDEWTVSGTTATYNQIMPEHYDVSGGKVVYTKAATVQTYATLKGIKSTGLKVSSDKKTIQSDSTDVITVSGKVITLAEGALNNAGVTLTSDDYSLALDNVTGPVLDSESDGTWSLSGKNGGIYKAKITEGGWGLKDAKTVTYTAASNSAVVGTITGLKSGVTVATLTEGIDVDTTEGTFTISEDLLTNTDVTLTNGNGFGYSLATDANKAENVHSWDVADTTDGTTATANLYYGKSAYYVASDDGTTLAYNKPESGSSVATIQFLKAGTTAEDMPADDEITKAAKAKNYTIPLSADVLTTKTVTLTGSGYVLALDEDLSAKANQLIWDYADNKKNDTTATLSTYKTEGWAPNSAGTRIEYTAPVKGATLATLKGVKSGLKQIGDGEYDEVGTETKTRVYNNFTSGITVYTEATTETITGSKTGETERKYAANTIAIEKAAVVDGITLTNSAYSLAVGKDLTNSTATDGWTFDTTKGTATYTYTTPAGYSVEESGTTSTLNVAKSTKLTATLTGLNVSDENAQKAVEALAVDNTEHIITLTKSVLDGKPVTVKGNYTLNADDIAEPKLGTPTWDMSKKGTAILYGAYTVAGYTLDAKGTTLTYTQPADGTKKLATVSGLNANASSDGLALKGTTVTLSSNVLGTSKITIKNETGSDYKLALNASDKNIATEAKTETAWTVKGTTATLQTSSTAYYSQDENTGAIIYNKPGSATVHATVSGLLKDAEIDTNTDYNSTTKTLTLTTDMLGTAAQVKLTDKDNGGYKLALDGDVPQTEAKVTEWVRSGTKATYQTYTKGYYTKASGTQINYTKDKDVTVHLTLNGIQADIDDSALDKTEMKVTLNADQLNATKNKVTTKLTTSKAYTGYTIALDGDVTVPDSDKATWTVDGKGKANYIQNGTANTFVLDAAGTTVTYYDTETPLTLATLSGLNKNITDNAFADVTVEDGVITLTSDVLTTDDNKSTKVSVSTKGYTLAIDSSLEPKTTDLGWDFKTLAKSGTVTKNNQLGEGYIVDTKGTSVSYSAAKDKNTVITLSGLNKNYGGGQTAAAAGITVDDDTNVVTLSNADLLTTSKITLKNGTGANYTLNVNDAVLGEKDLDAETAVWTLKGTTATLSVGTSAYYKQNAKSATTVDYIKEVANTPVATLSGLGKTAKVDGGKLGYLNNKVFTQGVFINKDTSDAEGKTYNISFYPEVLGTSDVTLSNTAGSGYTYNLTADNLSAPQEGDNIWAYDASKGTATLTQTVVAGWTLKDSNNLEYKADKDNAVLTTLSGLSKTFNSSIDAALTMPATGETAITIEDPDLLGTSKATLKNATGYTYTLALGSAVPQTDTLQEKQWLTSGTKASLKDYNQAFYKADGTSITYTAAKDVAGRVYAEVSGIAKDVDISSRVSGNVITLGADQLADKNVTLTNKTVGTDTASFKLALGDDSLKATLDESATWTTKSGTATLTGKVTKGYTLSADGLKLTYAKNDTTPVIATIKGVNVTLEGSYNTSNTTFTLGADSLTSVVTIDGKEIFDFKFSKGYDGAKITGAATADTINAAGDNLNINTGNGNDVVTVSGASVTLTAGAGDDTISISGGNASINAGAGNDSIKSGGGNNTFYYATNNGSDTITGFATTDRIMTNAKATAISAKSLNGNAVITIGAGTKNASTITLTGKGNSVSSISIVDTKNNAITPSYAAASDVLLADNNYSTDAAALTDITDAFHASYTPYDFETGLDLVKKDSLAPVVSYMGDDK